MNFIVTLGSRGNQNIGKWEGINCVKGTNLLDMVNKYVQI